MSHLRVVHQPFASSPARGLAVRAVRLSSAGSDTTSEAAPNRSVTPTLSAVSTATRARLRNDSAAADSSAVSTTSVGRGCPQPSSSVESLARPRGLERARVEDRDRAALGVQRERAAQRSALLLAVDLEGVGARLGTEHRATASPDRRAVGARTRASGALLTPRLRATAGDHPTRFRSRGSATAGGLLGAHALVDERAGEARAERGIVELDFLRRGGAQDRCVRHRVRTSTIPPLRARDRAAHEQEVLLAVDAHDLDALLGDALVAHLAGPADALHHARGPRRGADRAGRANVVRAVRLRAAGEVVALDRALKALALGRAGDLHARTGLERLDGHRLAELQLPSLAAELRQAAHRRRIGLLEVAEFRLVHVLLLAQAKCQLHGFVAVAFGCANGRHRARAGLEHGHARDVPVFLEDLGHAELLCEDRGHRIRSRGESRCRRPRAGGRGAGASRPSWASAGGCRSDACACGSRSARASPCP